MYSLEEMVLGRMEIRIKHLGIEAISNFCENNFIEYGDLEFKEVESKD